MTLTLLHAGSFAVAALSAWFLVASYLAAERSGGVSRFGDYVLEEKLGQGGMGVVYRARLAHEGTRVALKTASDPSDAKQHERFEREIASLRAARHPNVVALRDHGRTSGGIAYLVMEHVDGVDLERLLAARGAVSPERAVAMLLELCDALSAVHAAGLVHRDVKPANVMLYRGADGSEHVKLVDFGLAKDRREVELPEGNDAHVVGSPENMAPECVLAPAEVGPAADLYAVGVLAYTLLTGEPPFAGDVVRVFSQHLYDAPPALGQRVPALSDELCAAIASCLEKSAARRPASANALRRALVSCPEAGRLAR